MISRRLREQDCRDLCWSLSAVVVVNLDSLILAASRPFETMFGYLQGELVGKSLLDLLPPVRKEDADMIRSFCLSMTISPVPTTLKTVVAAVCKDGTQIDVTVMLSSGFLDESEQVGMAIVSQVRKGVTA